MKLTTEEILFLSESNAIEGVFDDVSLEDAKKAWRYLVGEKKLTEKVILKTHKILMANQAINQKDKGIWRTCQVYIGGREAPRWEKMVLMMGQWIINANDIVINGKNEDEGFLERIIKEQHVRFEYCHPFLDGNGRCGRLCMNWQRLQVGLPILVIKEVDKYDYYGWFA